MRRLWLLWLWLCDNRRLFRLHLWLWLWLSFLLLLLLLLTPLLMRNAWLWCLGCGRSTRIAAGGCRGCGCDRGRCRWWRNGIGIHPLLLLLLPHHLLLLEELELLLLLLRCEGLWRARCGGVSRGRETALHQHLLLLLQEELLLLLLLLLVLLETLALSLELREVFLLCALDVCVSLTKRKKEGRERKKHTSVAEDWNASNSFCLIHCISPLLRQRRALWQQHQQVRRGKCESTQCPVLCKQVCQDALPVHLLPPVSHLSSVCARKRE